MQEAIILSFSDRGLCPKALTWTQSHCAGAQHLAETCETRKSLAACTAPAVLLLPPAQPWEDGAGKKPVQVKEVHSQALLHHRMQKADFLVGALQEELCPRSGGGHKDSAGKEAAAPEGMWAAQPLPAPSSYSPIAILAEGEKYSIRIPTLEGTHKNHQVQLLASNRIT